MFRIFSIFILLIGSLLADECEKIEADPDSYFVSQNGKISDLDFDFRCKNSLHSLEFLKELYEITMKIRGENVDCSGNLAIQNDRFFQRKLALAGYSPEIYKSTMQSDEIYDQKMNNNRKYFRTWAHKSIGNFALYKKFNAEYQNSLEKLVDFYIINFGYDHASAAYYATRSLNEFLDYAVGSYGYDIKFSKLEDSITNPLFDENELAAFIYSSQIPNLELNNALCTAILEDRGVNFMRILISRGADINSGDESALFFALKNLEYVKFLLKNGADINYKNSFGKSAIFYATQFGDENLVKLLIQNGAKVNDRYIKNIEKSALASNNLEPFYQNLCALNHTSKSVFMHASQHSNPKILEILIQNGADINATDDMGFNALDFAIYGENLENINYLKNLGLKELEMKGNFNE